MLSRGTVAIEEAIVVRFTSILAAALLAAATAQARPVQRGVDDAALSPLAGLETAAPRLLSSLKIASLSVAIVENGEIAEAHAWGQASPSQPATIETLYNVASLTKPVSAEVAMRLAAQGRISLDEPMSAYWVDPDVANDPRSTRLTPRLVMSHRSGLPNWRPAGGGKLSFINEPGETFGYSGEGFEWLARFIEAKTGEPFEDLAQALVFEPSAMRDTAYSRRTWFEGRLAVPYDADLEVLAPQVADHFFASDDLISTPRDYARFVVGMLQKQGVTPDLYLDREKLQTVRRTQTCLGDEPDCAAEDGFGLGWETFLIGGRRFLVHTGMEDGTFTFVYLEPETGAGLVLFTNSTNGWKAVLPILELTGADTGFIAHLQSSIS